MEASTANTIAAIGTWAQAVAGLAGAGAVIYAARIGAATFDVWLKQRQTERRIAAAERILSLAYRFQRVFPSVRNPALFQGEMEAAEKLLQEGDPAFLHAPDAKRRLMVSAQVYVSRLHSHCDDWEQLFACLPLARAYFGRELEEALNSFWVQRCAIHGSAQMYAELDELDRPLRDQVEGDLWEGWNSGRKVKDPISIAIASAMSVLEARLLPILGTPSTG
jgi:hypothetical protein